MHAQSRPHRASPARAGARSGAMAMKRRDFLKAMSATGLAAAAGPMFIVDRADAAEKLDLGMVRSVKVDVISETSWFDNDRFKANMTEGGGASTSQYTVAWDPENAGGYSALVTVTTLQGEEKRILLDSGWNNAWMDYVFEKKGIPRMLQRGEIDFMVLSHWHLDHLWGIESTLKHNPKHQDHRAEDLLPGGHGAPPREGPLHREGQGRPRGGPREERRPAHGRARAHRARGPGQRGHLQAHARRRGEDVRRADPAPRPRRERPLLQRAGQGDRDRHRLLPPGHPLPVLLREAELHGLPALRRLRRAAPRASSRPGIRSSTTSSRA